MRFGSHENNFELMILFIGFKFGSMVDILAL